MTKNMVGILIRMAGVVGFCLLLLLAFTQARRFSYEIFADQPYRTQKEAGKNVEIEVKEGESLSEIAKELEEKDIIKSAFKFKLASKYMDASDEVKPGTYSVNASMRPSEILNIIAQKEEY